MSSEGPVLESLTRRLAECPPEFLLTPRIGSSGTIHVLAVVNDLLRDLGGPTLDGGELARWRRLGDHRHLHLILVACWLLHDPWFREHGGLAEAAEAFLREDLAELAKLVSAERFVDDPDRREELARLCLSQLDLRPGGENETLALDRLTTLSSVERRRVVRASQAAERRAREIREAMERQAAEEAAAKYTRE